FVDNQVNFGSVEDCFLSTHKKSVKSNFCKITSRKCQTNPFLFLVANFAIGVLSPLVNDKKLLLTSVCHSLHEQTEIKIAF
ncbi:hypothetical protein, partial [Clostridium paraputrificum]|uniref:hypothetical protein n=1 Tax=Clostridium paraputrificum TaxID=29363 RepID=UPI00374F2830